MTWYQGMAVGLAALMSLPLSAQTNDEAAPMELVLEAAEEEPGISVTRTSHQDWQSMCVTEAQLTTCEISQTLQVESEGQTAVAMRATLSKPQDEVVMEIALPLGLFLPSGVVLKVDGSEEITLPYTICIAQGCAAITALDATVLGKLRAGGAMRVGFQPFGQDQAVVLDVSLRGISSALRILDE